MAIKQSYETRAAQSDGKREMTIEEFKKWIKTFDGDKDGRISGDELREAIRVTGVWWRPGRKGKKGVKSADADGDGFINEDEINNLVEFAQKEMGIRIVPY